MDEDKSHTHIYFPLTVTPNKGRGDSWSLRQPRQQSTLDNTFCHYNTFVENEEK